MCVLIMVQSSSPRWWLTGVPSMAPTPSSSTRDHPGKTPGSSRLTASSVTSCSTCGSSIRCLKPRVIIKDWHIDYNANRPHTAHGDLTPNEFATLHRSTMTALPNAA